MNSIFKYVDDNNLLAPQCTEVCLLEEFDNVKQLASSIKKHINPIKTKELGFACLIRF